MTEWMSKPEIKRFKEYLKIKSVHPTPDYESCVEFLRKQAEDLDLPISVHEFVPGKPVVVISFEGLQPSLPSILLNSHMDVVPVYEEHWTYPPFAAHVTDDGMIYARGIQDMKAVGMLHLEAVRRIKQAGKRLKRTIHISFVPDEEIGSQDGMKKFSESPEFKRLNVGFELDESCPNPAPDIFTAFHGERTSRQIKIICKGKPTHGSFLESDTAGEKIHYMIDKFMALRSAEKKRLDSGLLLGDVTTINLTQLQGGVQVNVLPEELSVVFDIRIAPDVDMDQFEEMINRWCKEAGGGVKYEYFVRNPLVKNSRKDNPHWIAILDALKELGITVFCEVCPGATDARFMRLQGIPAFNLTPVVNTPVGIHCHDEQMHAREYMRGIDFMTTIVEAAANV